MISIYIIETLSLVSPPLARKESDDYIASGLMHSLMFFFFLELALLFSNCGETYNVIIRHTALSLNSRAWPRGTPCADLKKYISAVMDSRRRRRRSRLVDPRPAFNLHRCPVIMTL